jgi:SAM-dependent methyltransferase
MNAARSTLGARVSGRRAGQRFDAEHGVATEALIFLGDLDPEAIGPNIVHATHYEPTPVAELAPLLAHVPFPLRGATFVDVGAGMGRALMLAARYDFRQVIGIEISPALHAIACDNFAGPRPPAERCRDVRLVRADAASYRFPSGPLVAYLYNPFDAALLAKVLDRLATGPPRDLAVLYHTPVHRDVIEAHDAFERVADEPVGAVYRRKGHRV